MKTNYYYLFLRGLVLHRINETFMKVVGSMPANVVCISVSQLTGNRLG